jgi:hypothetical protein
MPGKRIQIDDETWPTDLKTALRQSAGVSAKVVPLKRKKTSKR